MARPVWCHNQFCKDNADNQGALFEYLDFFLKMMGKVCIDRANTRESVSLHVGLDDGCQLKLTWWWSQQDLYVAVTINEMFHNNRALCSQITEVQIRKIVNAIETNKLPRYIQVLMVQPPAPSTREATARHISL